MRAHSDTQAPAVSVFRPELAPLDPVFARALAKKPSDRFATCREFAAALEASPPASGPGTEPDLYCWGYGGRGELMLDDGQSTSLEPVRIKDLDFVTAVSIDPYGTVCAISRGDLYC